MDLGVPERNPSLQAHPTSIERFLAPCRNMFGFPSLSPPNSEDSSEAFFSPAGLVFPGLGLAAVRAWPRLDFVTHTSTLRSISFLQNVHIGIHDVSGNTEANKMEGKCSIEHSAKGDQQRVAGVSSTAAATEVPEEEASVARGHSRSR